jgi:hypothetical protein
MAIYCVVFNRVIGDCWYIEAESRYVAATHVLKALTLAMVDHDEPDTWEILECDRPFSLCVAVD